jgi:hypothetical protein
MNDSNTVVVLNYDIVYYLLPYMIVVSLILTEIKTFIELMSLKHRINHSIRYNCFNYYTKNKENLLKF